MPIDYDHTQPFQENRCYFAHNGTITDLVTEGGTSDSLLFFRKILGQIGKGLTPQEAFRENLQTIKNYTAINAILLGEKTSYILNKFTKNPRFFTMKYLRSDDFVIVSSERLSTVPGEWSELGDGRLLTVDCLNLNLSVTIV